METQQKVIVAESNSVSNEVIVTLMFRGEGGREIRFAQKYFFLGIQHLCASNYFELEIGNPAELVISVLPRHDVVNRANTVLKNANAVTLQTVLRQGAPQNKRTEYRKKVIPALRADGWEILHETPWK